MRNFLFITALFFIPVLSAQTLDFNFESGNLTGWQQNIEGRWGIDSLTPISGQKSLHHIFDNPEGSFDGISYHHEILCLDSTTTTWEFKVKYDYTPSSGNNWAFWLVSDQGVGGMFPAGSASGYIVGVNFTGSDDMLKLWYQNAGSSSVVFNTNFNWQNSLATGDTVIVRVERTITGEWAMSISNLADNNWQYLGGVSETSTVNSEYFGIYYEYSSSQDRKLWIDDISIQGLFYIDTYPPFIESFDVTDRNEIIVFFSEEIDTSKNISFLLNSEWEPQIMEWINLSQVRLKFSNIFSIENHLSIGGLADLKGNEADGLSINFHYYEPIIYDVVVSEIFADPIPSVGLPEAEFLEILNRSEYPVSLDGWKLMVGDNMIDFPEKIVYPGVYYILTDDGDLWSDYTDSLVIDISSMPALPNDGTTIQLYDRYNSFVSGVEYSSALYETDFKQEGGWSLELVDVEKPCLLSGNWKESFGLNGGTPGTKNSVDGTIENISKPELVKIFVADSSTIILQYSNPMDSLSVTTSENYSIDQGNKILSISTYPPFFQQVKLELENFLVDAQISTLSISDEVHDCVGSTIDPVSFQFGLPRSMNAGSMVINEILYESNDEVPEFIELYNLSESALGLRNCSLAILDNSTDEYSKSVLISSEYLQVLPGDYMVITADKELLQESFPDCVSQNVLELNKWLSLNNEGGTIVILNESGDRIDLAVFSPDMHFSLLFETSGVSLEKVSPEKSGLATSNWHSAASDVNYATPTWKNSQLIEESEEVQNFYISPKELSPNNDGFNDILNIQYNFSKPGFLASIKIFSRGGFLVKDLVNNELCGTSGSFTWNGLNEDESRLPMGYYIIMLEAIHPEGEVIQEKKTILMLPEKK